MYQDDGVGATASCVLDRARVQQLLLSGLQITGWGQGADGELYLTAGNGGLYRLD